MRKKCKWMKKIALCLTMVLAVTLVQGCGSPKTDEDRLAGMQEFASPDGSASIYLDKNWETEEGQYEGWLFAGSQDGREALFLLQFPKRGTNRMAADMEDMKTLVKDTYSISGEAETEAPEVPGVENVSAETATLRSGSHTADTYMVYGETDYAYYTFVFVAYTMSDDVLANAKVSCSKFVEQAPEEEDSTTVEITDTVRWFNASYAILTEINGWDYTRFAGLAANEETKTMEQQSLSEWWGVTDRASADETLDWALNEGHRANFVEEMDYLKQGGFFEMDDAGRTAFLDEHFSYNTDEIAYYAAFYPSAYEAYEQKGAKAIAGWDYCRAMNLLSFYYLAGYYTETEALDKSLEIAQLIQPEFTSWDEMMESYLLGYEYWGQESSDERRGIYEDLKSREDNPYAVDYNLTFEKTW